MPSEKKQIGTDLWICHYDLGETFLIRMYELLGHDAGSASLRQLYELSEHLRRERLMSEDDIYQVFLSNTPTSKQEEFNYLYSCLHGRPIPGYTPAARGIPTHVRDALVALYHATNGPDWKNNENWLSQTPVDQWHGVTAHCGSVIYLDLAANNLVGPIQPQLGELSNLVHLDLGRNKLTGQIPPGLGNLSSLVRLDLGQNELTGQIPSELANLSNLSALYLSENQVTGQIPPELGELGDTLYLLYLAGNQLTGCVPQGLAAVENSDINGLGLEICERQFCRVDERHPAEEMEHLSVREGHIRVPVSRCAVFGQLL